MALLLGLLGVSLVRPRDTQLEVAAAGAVVRDCFRWVLGHCYGFFSSSFPVFLLVYFPSLSSTMFFFPFLLLLLFYMLCLFIFLRLLLLVILIILLRGLPLLRPFLLVLVLHTGFLSVIIVLSLSASLC